MPPSCWKCGSPPCRPGLPPTPSDSRVFRGFGALLASNAVPKSSEIISVLHVIANSLAQMDLLESLQTTLVQVSRQREEAAEFLHQHRTIISPARRIPEEMLYEIFSLTLPRGIDG
ncbi:hypothetical protein DFH09DRAFT_1178385 [Mycena vulgaris]|nr:hypothetical protein DFH09DRAFT_1178385 [Mycena vulgaris]